MLKGKSRSNANLPLLGLAFTGARAMYAGKAHSPLLHRRREEDYLTGLTKSARGLDSLLGQNGYTLSLSLFHSGYEGGPGSPSGRHCPARVGLLY